MFWLSNNTAQVDYGTQLWAYVRYMNERGLGPWNSWLFWWLSPLVLFAMRNPKNRVRLVGLCANWQLRLLQLPAYRQGIAGSGKNNTRC